MNINELRVCELKIRSAIGINKCNEPIECIGSKNRGPCGWFKERHKINIESKFKRPFPAERIQREEVALRAGIR